MIKSQADYYIALLLHCYFCDFTITKDIRFSIYCRKNFVLPGMHTHSDRKNSTKASVIVNCTIHPLLQKATDLHLGHGN